MKNNKTKKRIASSLSEMMTTQDVDKITVTDIVRNCNISRQSFYYHFQDIEDVMEWIIKDVARDVIEKSVDITNIYDSINLLIHTCQSYRQPIAALMRSQKREALELTLVQVIRDALNTTLSKMDFKYGTTEQEHSYFLDFYTYGIAGFIFERKLIGDEEIDEITSFIYEIFRKALES